jgi:hypothetical protein
MASNLSAIDVWAESGAPNPVHHQQRARRGCGLRSFDVGWQLNAIMKSADC